MKASIVISILSAGMLLLSGCNAQGKKVYMTYRCAECHSINGAGGSGGPNLTYVGSKRSREFLHAQIREPKKINSNTNMPSFKEMPEKDMDALLDYLQSMK
jgi:mono/diheme cytochrome c family protein